MPALSSAAAKKLSAAHILLGPELGKKQQAMDEIRKKIAGTEKPDSSNLEETVFYAGDTPAGQIASKIQNHSLFAQTRLFLIKRAELIDKKEDIDLIASCIKHIEDGTFLVLISDENKLSAGLEAVVPSENRRVFYELFEREKNQWLRDFFRQQGFIIDADGIETILELVENNTEAMGRECSRLIHFLRDPQKPEQDQKISAAEIEQWLSHSREESAFTLFSRIAAGDIPKALESLKAILAERKFHDRTAQMTLAGIASCFRKLKNYHVLLESGRADNVELRKIGIFAPKSRDEYAAAARLYSSAAVDSCLAITAEYDILIRSLGNAFEKILADVYIMKIAARGQGVSLLTQ